MSLFGNHDSLSHRNTCFGDIVAFSFEGNRVENNSVTDDVDCIWSENAGWHTSQNETLAFEMKRVACIRASLETCNDRVVACKHVNDFTFSFIAPLEAEYYI